MVLAVVLLTSSHDDYINSSRTSHLPGTPDAFVALMVIDAPAALARMMWTATWSNRWSLFTFSIGYRLMDAIFVASVGALWYWITVGIEAWQERNFVRRRAASAMQFAGELVLVGIGLCILWFSRTIDLRVLPWTCFGPSLVALLIWSFGPLCILGLDLSRFLALHRARQTHKKGAA
jgi:hypothetical protein